MTRPAGLYLEWRERGAHDPSLHDASPEALPPERWLQELWAHQRLLRDQLTTSDGRRLTILHPGFWNRESGPDFLNAIIQIENDEPVSGDVEIDLKSSGWKSHGHAGNAAYQNVILHVVWEPAAGEPPLPTLVIKDRLDAPVEELRSWVGGAGELPPACLEGACCAPLQQLSPAALLDVLHQAALVRLRTKALHFRARARGVGWHQALWEGVFRALGYKHNAWPMQGVAELLPDARKLPIETRNLRESWEARLLGLAGLLPPEPGKGTRARRLWDLWWRERESFSHRTLPPGVWRLNGVRPANHPQRRLALAAAWIARPDWESRLEDWYARHVQSPASPVADEPKKSAEDTLLELLRPEADGFWRRHYTLTARELPEAPPLLGAGRVNDLAVNAILPWFWARADAGADAQAREKIEVLYLDWSPGEDNSTLKLARARLLEDASLPGRKTAALQQGMLQIVRDFCAHSNALCQNCRFPGLVERLRAGAAGVAAAPPPES
jgi:hypothetical protein